MPRGRSPMGIVFLTIFLDLVGFGIVLPLLPRFAAEYQAEKWQIGLLMATYSLMQFFLSPVWGRLSDRIGRRPVLLISITGSAISYALFAFAGSLPMLFVARIVAGGMAANIGTAQAYIADITTPENRARGMGMVGAAFGLGFVFGPALAGLLSHYALENGWRPQLVVGLAATMFSVLDLVLAAVRLPESLTPELRARATAPTSGRLARMQAALRSPALGLPIIVLFLSTAGWSALEPTLGLLSRDRFNLNEAQTGYLFAYLGVIVAFVQGGLTGRMARRSGETRMAMAGALLLTIALALIPSVRHWGPLLGILALLAVGQAMLLPGVQSLISRAASRDEQGATLGASQGFSSLARVVGPAAGGVLYGVGQNMPLWFSAGLLGVTFLLTTRLRPPE